MNITSIVVKTGLMLRGKAINNRADDSFLTGRSLQNLHENGDRLYAQSTDGEVWQYKSVQSLGIRSWSSYDSGIDLVLDIAL